MSSLASSTILVKNPRTHFISANSSVQRSEFLGSSNNVVLIPYSQRNLKPLKCRSPLTVRASGDDRPGSASIFVSGFVLGGIVVGALGCIYAPQISKALAGTDRKDLMRKLPKFIYDEEKALEKTRKVLTEKIEQLNAAIDEVSSQLRADDAPPNGAAPVSPDEVEASI